MATIDGDGGNNTLVGFAEDDTINGFGGADSLSGLAGTDLIFGGTGDDTAQGGAGNDMIFGDEGDDTIIHVFGDNEGTMNEYDGGGDTDVLRLELTSAELIDLVNDLRALDTQMTVAPGSQYSFNAVNLVVDNFETIEIVVDGVVVAADDLPDVADNVITVTESEAAGDTDVNVLDNDNSTTVVEVDGAAGNVGVAVAGSSGGLFTINADGTTDFNANSDFEGLGVGESAVTEITYGAEVTGVQGTFDIILTQDLSSSFSDDLPNVRTSFDGLFDALSADGNDVGFGVASFVDKPFAPFGSSGAGDFAYRTDQGVSTDKATTQGTLDALTTFNGLDSDESQLVALQQIALRAETEVGFRAGAQRFIVLQTDADPHVAGDFSAAGADDGDTDVSEAEDYPTVASVGALLNAANISVIFAISPQQTTIAAYQQLLADLGVAGTVVTLSSDSSNLSTAIQGALDTLTSTETATVTATVTGENDGPDAVADLATGGENETILIDVLNNDTDPDTNDVLTISSVDPAVRGTASIVGGQVQFDPGTDFDFLGVGESTTETLTYTITDGNGATDSATVTVTVNGANDDPTGVDDTGDVTVGNTVSIDVLANDTDPDTNDVLVIDSVDPAGRGTASVVGGEILFDPGTDFDFLGFGDTATETLTYTVSDGNGGTSTAEVVVTVTGSNTLPTATDDTATVRFNATTNIDVLANDNDPDMDTLTVIAVSDPANGVATINADNTINYDPDNTFIGDDTLTYTVSDGNGGTATAEVTVTVTNLAPFLQEPLAFFTPENQDLAAALIGLDPELFPVTYSIGGGADAGAFSVDPTTGVLSFQMTPDFENPVDADTDNVYEVDITVSDQFTSGTQSITVTVTDVNELVSAPEITFPTPTVPFGPVRQFISNASSGVLTDVEATDLDLPLGDTLEFSLFGEDAAQFSIDAATGEITLDQPLTDPLGSFDGDSIYEVIVVVEDSTGQSDTQEIDYLLFVGG
ncbi:MAG: Ig-like domain-containing protein [Pseudomonadota bacterium]